MSFEIIDFHCHPFRIPGENICAHISYTEMNPERTEKMYDDLGVSRFCGSVILNRSLPHPTWEELKSLNDEALALAEFYGGKYIPGFHVHPKYVDESLAEIERMAEKGVKLIGELVPYMHGWSPEDFVSDGFTRILRSATEHGMVVSFHSGGEDFMDEMVRKNPDTVFVAAHPGEREQFDRHLARMKMSENYYLDISASNILRYGLLRHGITECGKERFLFGTDFPTCNPPAFIGCVMHDDQLTDDERKAVFADNAKKLLGL